MKGFLESLDTLVSTGLHNLVAEPTRIETTIAFTLKRKDISEQQRLTELLKLIKGRESEIDFKWTSVIDAAIEAKGESGRTILKIWLKREDLNNPGAEKNAITQAAIAGDMETFQLLLSDPRLNINEQGFLSHVLLNKQGEILQEVLKSGRRFTEASQSLVIDKSIKMGLYTILDIVLQYHFDAENFIDAFQAAILYNKQHLMKEILVKYKVPEGAQRYCNIAQSVLTGSTAEVQADLATLEQDEANKLRKKALTIASFAGYLEVTSWLLEGKNLSIHDIAAALRLTKSVPVFEALYRDTRLNIYNSNFVSFLAKRHFELLQNVYQQDDAKLFEVLFERQASEGTGLLPLAQHLAILGKYNFIKIITIKGWIGLKPPIREDLQYNIFKHAAYSAQVSIMTLILWDTPEEKHDEIFEMLSLESEDPSVEFGQIAKFIGQEGTPVGQSFIDQHLWTKTPEDAKAKLSTIIPFAKELYEQEVVWKKAGRSLEILPKITPLIKHQDINSALLVCNDPSAMLAALPKELNLHVLSFLLPNNIDWLSLSIPSLTGSNKSANVTPFDVSAAIFDKHEWVAQSINKDDTIQKTNDKGNSIKQLVPVVSTTQPALFVERLNQHYSSRMQQMLTA